jgi:Protein of unknown function (DUF2934)
MKSSNPISSNRVESSGTNVVPIDANRHEHDDKVAASITDAEWRSRVAKIAYYKAERRAFAPGFEVQDWLAAEHELASYLVSVRYGLS